MLNTEQFTASNKAHFETLMGMAAKAFEGVEQLAALNLQVAKTSLDDTTEAGRAALSAKDPQSLLALQAGLLEPAAERAVAYGKQVYGIVVGIKADIERVAGEQAAAAQSSLVALMEAAGENAPEGSKNGLAVFKSTLATANNAFNSLQRAGRQTAEAAEANFAAVTGSVARSTAKAKRR